MELLEAIAALREERVEAVRKEAEKAGKAVKGISAEEKEILVASLVDVAVAAELAACERIEARAKKLIACKAAEVVPEGEETEVVIEA